MWNPQKQKQNTKSQYNNLFIPKKRNKNMCWTIDWIGYYHTLDLINSSGTNYFLFVEV